MENGYYVYSRVRLLNSCYNYFLHVIERVSKFSWLFACFTKKPTKCMWFQEIFFFYFYNSKETPTDNGTEVRTIKL